MVGGDYVVGGGLPRLTPKSNRFETNYLFLSPGIWICSVVSCVLFVVSCVLSVVSVMGSAHEVSRWTVVEKTISS